MFAIIGDSTCSLSKELRSQYNIDYFRMTVSYGEVEEYASLDWDIHSPKEYFDILRNGERIRTSQVSNQEFNDVFEKHLSNGEDVLYISCSSALSKSIDAGRKVAEELNKKYPERKIVCIDSLNSCMGQGRMLIKASELREEGKSLEEVSEYIEANKLKCLQFATVEKLDYLARNGRIKASKAFFGNLFGVKPIIISDRLGQNYAWKKGKGRLGSFQLLADLVKEYTVNPESQICYIANADDIEDAELAKKYILEKNMNFKDIVICNIDPIVGASTGPGTIGIYVMGNEVDIIGE